MSIIHHTTVTPGKLELLSPWLAAQPWFRGTGEPELTKAGGFRLDDPAGEVGIEFMVATDGATTYDLPMTYRGAPLAGAGTGLIGTVEHGVLGRRWVYDAVHDPVFVATLLALLRGEVTPQQQSISDAPDDTVIASCAGFEPVTAEPAIAANGAVGTEIRVSPDLVLRVRRVLGDGDDLPDCVGSVSGCWQDADGGQQSRDVFAVLLAG
jgi:hypothetical protein